jgi:predicted amidohydrolase
MHSGDEYTNGSIVAPSQMESVDSLKQGYTPFYAATVCMNAKNDKLANLEIFNQYIETAVKKNVNLIVFPEVSLQQNPGWGTISHSPTQEELAYVKDTAESIPGETTNWLTQKASVLGIYIIFGMTELGEDGNIYNSSVFLGPEGVIGKYRKHTLWDAETKGNEHCFYRKGNIQGVVIDSPLGKLGLMICIEMAYEYGPPLVKAGADLLVTVSAWPGFAGDIYERVTLENAAKSSCWHIVANQTGQVGQATDYGHSRIIDGNGNIVCDTGPDEGMVISMIPISSIQSAPEKK